MSPTDKPAPSGGTDYTASNEARHTHHAEPANLSVSPTVVSTRAESAPTSPINSEPQARVRFSLDTNGERPSTSGQSVPHRAATWNVGTPGGSSGAVEGNQRSPEPSRVGNGSGATQSRNRNRGYSLRRSIFAQNIERHNGEHGAVIEMEASSSSQTASGRPMSSRKKNGKTSPSVTIEEEAADVDEGFPTNPVRLSDPTLNLAFYSRWAKTQGYTSNSIIKRLRRRYVELRKRISRSKQLPPSVDGRHVRVNVDKSFMPIDERRNDAYITNNIRSCRYTLLNFVPRQLYAQFGKLANFYFLCVSILQMIPGLSTTGTYTTIVPLLIFVCISMAKEGYDDWRRYRLDKEENERRTLVLSLPTGDPRLLSECKSTAESEPSTVNSEAWRSETWQNLKVGDVILLERDQPVPADVILLQSSDAAGTAYIETKSLDGETNLKSKRPLAPIVKLCRDESATSRLEAEFIVEDPNLDLYRFDGKVNVGDETLPLTNGEVMYRGSILRNTDYIYGLVIYSGEECKIRMNANKNPRVKAPALQYKVNRVVVIVACLVLFIAIIMTVANTIWVKAFENHAWYLDSASVPFGHILTSFIIMFNTMLPLSLYVSLEIVKVAQIYFMNDIDMYDPESNTPMESRTSTINEELGQVSYIFSDKTGTLTNNSMRFRKMSVAGTAWLHDLDLQDAARAGEEKLFHKKRSAKGKAKSKQKSRKSSASALALSRRPTDVEGEWHPPTKIGASLQCGRTEDMLEYIQHRPQSVFARKARFFILGLAICHTCVPEKDDEGNITFQAESPDELALVSAAQEMGFIVSDRQSNTITVKTYPSGEDDMAQYETYDILDVIEFSSSRKRMSIIVRMPDSRICVFTKGADTTVRKLLRLKDIAEVNVANVQKRASIRKSLEIQEALRRKSIHTTQDGTRPSIGTIPTSPITGRKSSVSLGRGKNVRESIDAWLTERETDVDMARPRRSSTFYTPRPSVQVASMVEPAVRSSFGSVESSRSFRTDDMEVVIDESIVLNDSAIFERCFQHIDDFATEGLRTLLYGYRYIPENEYQQWRLKYLEASTSLVDRQEKIEEVGNLIESQFELLGATAIEDKLQDGVPDAIDRFRRAGIKMWMLTGDKRETAINIGHSCRLIKDYSTTIILDCELGDLPARMATAVADIHNRRAVHSVLVIDGQTLAFIDNDPASKALFTDLAIAADSVVCCRASPSQKAGLVKTIRTQVEGSVTLAIGDGANDIAMIQEAHVGIGIAGKEGLQAARTSDYSIAQFRFLLKLLLVHGRWNYVRVCKYTLGTFWKEMIFYLVQALYQRWTGYTGTSLYEPWSLSMFNTLFTSLPVIFLGIFEKDLTAPTLLAVPELYAIGRLNLGFNIPKYMCWAVLGGVEALVVYFTMYSIYGDAPFTYDQHIYAMGSLAFTACVILISFKLQFFELHNKSITAIISTILSVGGWFLWKILLNVSYKRDDPIYNVRDGLFHKYGQNALWWLTVLLIVLAVSILELILKAFKLMVRPNETELFQVFERDIDIKKRFEESAADLLQLGWARGKKKSSFEMATEEALEAEKAALEAQREAEIQEILDRPRTMDDENAVAPEVGIRRRHSTPNDEAISADRMPAEEAVLPKRSLDVSELFKSGFGTVRKGSMGLK